jgi:DNA-binding protein Fis
MASTRGNVSKAALVLGISRDTLRYKLKKMKDDGAP